MTTRVHIERLVLEGLPVQARDAEGLQQAISNELARLFIERGVPASMKSRAPAVGDAPSLRLSPSSQAGGIGVQIGAGIYDAVGGSTS